MLSRMSVYRDFHRQAFKQSIAGVKKTPVMTFITILMMAATLVLPVLLWMIASTAQRTFLSLQQEGGQTLLYLQPALSETTLSEMLQRVRQTPGVARAVLKTPAQALEMLQQQGLAEGVADLPDNPLPAVITVVPEKKDQSSAQLQAWAMSFKSLTGVVQVHFDKDWMVDFDHITHLLRALCYGLFFLFFMIVVFMMMHLLRHTITAERAAIRVLNWIGAPPAFIIRPYVYLGMWYGFWSAILALIGAKMIVISLQSELAAMPLISSQPFSCSLSYGQQLLFILMITAVSAFGVRLVSIDSNDK